MIIRWVKELEQAAKKRQTAQQALDGEKLGGPERSRIEKEISQQNRNIERYAQRINEDLKRAAEKRVKVFTPISLDSISDSQLRDYLLGVKRTTDRLNQQLKKEGGNAESYARSLKIQKERAREYENTAGANIKTLNREDAKLAKRATESKKRLDSRQDDLKRLQRELKRVSDERTKIEGERNRVQLLIDAKKRDLTGLENELRQAEAAKKNASRPDDKAKLKEKTAKLQQKIEQVKPYTEQHLKFQLEQFERIMEKVRFEVTQLHRAIDSAERDIAILKEEQTDLKRARSKVAENISKEKKRQGSLVGAIKDLDKAREKARAAGVRA